MRGTPQVPKQRAGRVYGNAQTVLAPTKNKTKHNTLHGCNSTPARYLQQTLLEVCMHARLKWACIRKYFAKRQLSSHPGDPTRKTSKHHHQHIQKTEEACPQTPQLSRTPAETLPSQTPSRVPMLRCGTESAANTSSPLQSAAVVLTTRHCPWSGGTGAAQASCRTWDDGSGWWCAAGVIGSSPTAQLDDAACSCPPAKTRQRGLGPEASHTGPTTLHGGGTTCGALCAATLIGRRIAFGHSDGPKVLAGRDVRR